MIPQKNQFSEVDEWDEPEEVIRVYSKEEIVALRQSDATKYRALSPWKIILAQVLVTAISMVFWSFFGESVRVSVYTQSAFLGGLISVLPTTLFLIRLELAKKSQRLNPGRFLAALVSGEFIKIVATLMLFVGIAYYVPGVLWVPLLVTYLLVLKCVWLAWLWR
ncbi:ATP synthase subunit I [Polynucleobacter sp. JS-Safj-400b-B2]|uniref:ATP synthase subunit I n=1 Tax=Polynucleobacter sp. JS-Safj-400b-B2 TaxID=2576921 RepID=UPI001C0CB170|nr:ATP synthase subunit I [Polynucleobacter sp. JS-Safj-400b-B2]MBU3625674.1 ATP synthase subunit I [Polynucleobacter sp. JS-Safj-400b-B2]